MNGYRLIIDGHDAGAVETLLGNTRLTGCENGFLCFEIAQRYILLADGTLIETVAELGESIDHEVRTVTYNGPWHVVSNWVYKASEDNQLAN